MHCGAQAPRNASGDSKAQQEGGRPGAGLTRGRRAHQGAQHFGGGAKGMVKGALQGSRHSFVARSKTNVGSLHLACGDGRCAATGGGVSWGRCQRQGQRQAQPPRVAQPALACRHSLAEQGQEAAVLRRLQRVRLNPAALLCLLHRGAALATNRACGASVPQHRSWSPDADEGAIGGGLHGHPRSLARRHGGALPWEAQLAVGGQHVAAGCGEKKGLAAWWGFRDHRRQVPLAAVVSRVGAATPSQHAR